MPASFIAFSNSPNKRNKMTNDNSDKSTLSLSPLSSSSANFPINIFNRHEYKSLSFNIHSSSGHSAAYIPENILHDNPTDQASRWSSPTNDTHQFVELVLKKPAIVTAITFGKYHKVHVCNLREFKIKIGLKSPATIKVLDSGLKNDTDSESFPLIPFSSINNYNHILNGKNSNNSINNQNDSHHTFNNPHPHLPHARHYHRHDANNGISTIHPPTIIPCRYLRIEPIAAWGSNFNFSIWHIKLFGIDNPSHVMKLAQEWNDSNLVDSWRLSLKFLREQIGQHDIYKQLEELSPRPLEDALVSALYEKIVLNKDFEGAELIIKSQGIDLFKDYVEGENHTSPIPIWTLLERNECNSNGNTFNNSNGNALNVGIGESRTNGGGDYPCPRGGHQMVWDPIDRIIYLFGGWDGHHDLSDFWMWHQESNQWSLISSDTSKEGGPGPRSCHKTCLHISRRQIFLMGKFVEQEGRNVISSGAGSALNELYTYNLNSREWNLICSDVFVMGGPPLIYDHQMVIDEQNDLLYIFGGKCIETGGTLHYAGMYKYDISMNKWTLLRSDMNPLSSAHTPIMKSRIGHSMIFDQNTGFLHVFAGQRNKDYLSDYYVYDPRTDTVVWMDKDMSKFGGPEPGFTQRATLDSERRRIVIFSGLMREKSLSSSPSNLSSLSIHHQQASMGGGNSTSNSSTSIAPSISSSSSRNIPKNTLWMFDLRSQHWYNLKSLADGASEPMARYAHQMIHDGEKYYLFGGNPGDLNQPRFRLNDFWQLEIRPSLKSSDIQRRVFFLLRKAHFIHLCHQNKIDDALLWLRNQVSAMVQHENQQESMEFRKLSQYIFGNDEDCSNLASDQEVAKLLWQEIVEMLPRSMQPPRSSMIL